MPLTFFVYISIFIHLSSLFSVIVFTVIWWKADTNTRLSTPNTLVRLTIAGK